MSPEQQFEQAIQRYTQDVNEYYSARKHYIDTVGILEAQTALDNATHALFTQEHVSAETIVVEVRRGTVGGMSDYYEVEERIRHAALERDTSQLASFALQLRDRLDVALLELDYLKATAAKGVTP